MKPEVDQVLGLSAAQLMTALAPLLPAGYAQGQGSLLGILMTLSAQEYERAADVRVNENADMRTLFTALAPRVSNGALRETLLAAAATREGSLTISALNAVNAELRKTLIALQTHLESEAGSEAAQKEVWDVLKRSAMRRMVRLG